MNRDPVRAGSLEDADERAFEVGVAGPGALLVAKTHKLVERLEEPDRLSDKDALDVLRLLRGFPVDELAERLRTLLAEPMAAGVAVRAIDEFERLFGFPTSPGSRMAARAAAGYEREDVVAASLSTLARELLRTLRSQG